MLNSNKKKQKKLEKKVNAAIGLATGATAAGIINLCFGVILCKKTKQNTADIKSLSGCDEDFDS